jgi:hypothetical protein
MTLLSTDVYEDVQYQKDAPIGTQKPIPAGVHEIELSWDRIYLRAMATLEGETLVMYRAPDATPHKLVDGTRRDTTHNRLCYRRAGHEWRLRDERLPWNHPDALVFASSYVGDMNAEWNKLDRVAHVYHNGFTVLDEDNVAHLYDPDLSYA